MTLVLKNPIYTKIINLFRVAYSEQLTKIVKEIEKTQKFDYARVFGISEVQLGRQMLKKKDN